MGKIYLLKNNKKTIREMIQEGKITEKIRILLEESYQRHEALYPDDCDTAFIKEMLSKEGELSSSDQERLQEILKYEIQEDEYPNGMLEMTFFCGCKSK